jgi:hypothetical protein
MEIEALYISLSTSLSLSLCLVLQPPVISHALSAREHAVIFVFFIPCNFNKTCILVATGK